MPSSSFMPMQYVTFAASRCAASDAAPSQVPEAMHDRCSRLSRQRERRGRREIKWTVLYRRRRQRQPSSSASSARSLPPSAPDGRSVLVERRRRLDVVLALAVERDRRAQRAHVALGRMAQRALDVEMAHLRIGERFARDRGSARAERPRRRGGAAIRHAAATRRPAARPLPALRGCARDPCASRSARPARADGASSARTNPSQNFTGDDRWIAISAPSAHANANDCDTRPRSVVFGNDAGHEVAVVLLDREVRHRRGHRDLDLAAAARRVAREQRAENAARGIQAGHRVRGGGTDDARRLAARRTC